MNDYEVVYNYLTVGWSGHSKERDDAVAALARIRAEALQEAAERLRNSPWIYTDDSDGQCEPYDAILVELAIAAILADEPKESPRG